tara:strand:+ start:648 stop:827 length:180 start_codon:yes stop_codon:yes gene_type:complete
MQEASETGKKTHGSFIKPLASLACQSERQRREPTLGVKRLIMDGNPIWVAIVKVFQVPN